MDISFIVFSIFNELDSFIYILNKSSKRLSVSFEVLVEVIGKIIFIVKDDCYGINIYDFGFFSIRFIELRY